MFLKTISKDFVSLLYPRPCVTCGDILTSKERFLCLKCEINLPIYEDQYLTNILADKFRMMGRFGRIWSFLQYQKSGSAQALLKEIKYKGNEKLATYLGSKMAKAIPEYEYDLIIPVPLHDKRLKQRGYNQSEKLADGFALETNSSVRTDVVHRTKQTLTQTKKGKVERWMNMENVFQVSKPEEVENKRIILMDDVVTTGATIGMLYDVIIEYDPLEVSIITLAARK